MAKRKRDEIRSLAQLIADDLLTMNGGRKAQRVALIDEEGRDMGGWGPEPFTATIESRLRRAAETKRPVTPNHFPYS